MKGATRSLASLGMTFEAKVDIGKTLVGFDQAWSMVFQYATITKNKGDHDQLCDENSDAG